MAELTGQSKSNRAACSTCRQRKTACDRGRPRCSLCSRNNFECRYVTTGRTPGLRAGYVSQLERRLALLEERMNHIEAGHSGTSPTVHLSPPEDDGLRPVANESPMSVSRQGSLNDEQALGSTGNAMDLEVARSSYDPGVDLFSAGSPFGAAAPSSRPTATSAFNNNSLTVISELIAVWFEQYHPWFPILHQPSLLEVFQTSPDLESCDRRLVIKAIVATTLEHCRSRPFTAVQRQESIDRLGREVLLEALHKLSLRSIQSLLIISIADYGSGKMIDFWNKIVVCKRMSAQLGLRDFVTGEADRSNYHDTILSRLLPVNKTIISREERVRAYWMTEMIDTMSTLGTTWNTAVSMPIAHCVLPCSDALWAFPEHIISVWSLGQFRYSSAFSLCIILVATELSAVHEFLRQKVDWSNTEAMLSWQSEAQKIDDRLTSWREEFVASVFRLINAELPQIERSEMDPNIVLTNCMLNMSIIVLFQRLVQLPAGIEADHEPWAYATNRCVYACENMAAKVRRMDDEDLLVGNPHLIPCLFVSARFFIVWSKTLAADVPSHLRSLAYALHVYGQRWPLARRYGVVVRTAVSEHRTPVLESSLPKQFFDLRYYASEIDDVLCEWVDKIEKTAVVRPGPGLTDVTSPVSGPGLTSSLLFTPPTHHEYAG